MILCGRRVLKFGGHGKDVAKNLLKRNDFEQVEYNENYVPQIGDIMSSHFQVNLSITMVMLPSGMDIAGYQILCNKNRG